MCNHTFDTTIYYNLLFLREKPPINESAAIYIFSHIRLTQMISTAICLLVTACGNGGNGSSTGAAPDQSALSNVARLGETIFKDTSLSASGSMSCESCHSPGFAYAQPNILAVPLGGAALDQSGFRNTPSLKYLQSNPAFFFDAEGTPTGGFNRDGRANSLAEQARRPFLAAHEMANASAADVISRLSRASYAADFKRHFGERIFDDPAAAFDRVTLALAQYQKEDADFRPFDSKYDAFLAGRVRLSDQELRGLSLFNSPAKGNCAACHISTKSTDGSPPLFTDFTYDNIGVPRNRAIAATADENYFDLGLCGPDRQDLKGRSDLCGAFKVPTLRNVANTAPYFHNGRFATLREVVAFYIRRDTHPEEWYPRNVDGSVKKFDDLPAEFHKNVNISEAPYNRKPGDVPALNDAEINDVVAFLNTLTDGFKP